MHDEEDTSIDEMLQGLLDYFVDAETDEAVHSALISNASQIRLISNACQQTEIFKRSKRKFQEFKDEFEETNDSGERLVSAWMWFLSQIVEAPTRTHMFGSVRLCFPLVACYLPEEKKPNEVL